MVLDLLNVRLYIKSRRFRQQQRALFLAIVFLRRFCQICPFLGIIQSGFHFFRFRNSNFLQNKVISLASNPQPGGPVSVFMFPSDRVAKVCPKAPGSLFVVFSDLQGYGGRIRTRRSRGTSTFSVFRVRSSYGYEQEMAAVNLSGRNA
jgi:hypothetical protein